MFSVNNWIVLLLQNAVSVFNIMYLRKSLSRLGYERKFDWLLALMTLMYPSQFINANIIAPDILLQSTVLVYFASFVKLVQGRKVTNAVYMTLALIAGLFIKPVLYPFVWIHIIVLLVVAWQCKVPIRRIVLPAVLPFLAVVLYSGWNYERTGKYHFSSMQSFNAIFYYQYFFADREGDVQAGKDFLEKERKKVASFKTFKEQYEYANNRGVSLLKENAAAYLPYHLKYSAKLLVDPGKGELDMFLGRLTLGGLYRHASKGFFAVLKEKDLSSFKAYMADNITLPFALVIVVFNMLRLLGLCLFLWYKENNGLVRLLVAGLTAYFILLAGPISNPRYFIPVSLIVMGASVLGYQQYFKKKKSKQVLSA
jgi:hypothetical protein